MLKKIILPLGILLLIGSAAWYFLVTPKTEDRFDEDWTWNYDIDGSYAEFPEGTDETIYETPISDYDIESASVYKVSINKDRSSDERFVIESYYADIDAITEEEVYSYTTEYLVDPANGKYLDEELSEYYYMFPRNLEKKAYPLYDDYYGVTIFEYVSEETIGGLKVYKFRHSDEKLDETETYIETEYLAPDTELGVACQDVELYYWVEPTTGDILKLEENCPREYYFNLATGEDAGPYGRWYYESSGDDLQKRSEEIKSELNSYRWQTLYAPLLLLGSGLILLIGGLLAGRMASQEITK